MKNCGRIPLVWNGAVLQGAFSSSLHHLVFQDYLHQKEKKGLGRKVEKGWSHLGQEE